MGAVRGENDGVGLREHLCGGAGCAGDKGADWRSVGEEDMQGILLGEVGIEGVPGVPLGPCAPRAAESGRLGGGRRIVRAAPAELWPVAAAPPHGKPDVYHHLARHARPKSRAALGWSGEMGGLWKAAGGGEGGGGLGVVIRGVGRGWRLSPFGGCICVSVDLLGTEGVVGLTRWFEKMESVFSISNCPATSQVKFATCTLQDDALTWWNAHVKTTTTEAAHAMPWEALKKMMTDKYCPR
ncbi:hypothetical protein Tco_0631683, partial [Tanacetum coccineum]